MRVWRISREKYWKFDGEGASAAGGRWNSKGTAMVYTSATLSLAALEYLVNAGIEEVPVDLISISAEVPDSLSRRELKVEDLPAKWRTYPAPGKLAEIGTAWAKSLDTALLIVPSAVIPEEKNWLVNPRHPDAGRIRIEKKTPFQFDPRMRRKSR
ncbi:MAG TPA: RES family NAD+ phosphorylase [Thermoanaerobaculia bacterium]|nr:RES family NAD+ phosphorylase [Thermoanaerobaculia bacterium]